MSKLSKTRWPLRSRSDALPRSGPNEGIGMSNSNLRLDVSDASSEILISVPTARNAPPGMMLPRLPLRSTIKSCPGSVLS